MTHMAEASQPCRGVGSYKYALLCDLKSIVTYL